MSTSHKYRQNIDIVRYQLSFNEEFPDGDSAYLEELKKLWFMNKSWHR